MVEVSPSEDPEGSDPAGPRLQRALDPDPGLRPLTALGGAGLLSPLLPCQATLQVARWLRGPERVLWVQGRSGFGRTTACGAAVRALLAETGAPLRGALRVEASPGMRFEEALFEIDVFLRQLGIGELDRVLTQRASLASKIAILLEVLKRHPILIWLDDFEHLSASGGEPGGADPGRSLRFFARGWEELSSGAGRLLLVTEGDGPDGLSPAEMRAPLLVVDSRSAIDPRELRSRLRSAEPLPEGLADDSADGTELSPLSVRLRHASLAGVSGPERAKLAARTRDAGVEELVGEVLETLHPVALRALQLAAALRAPLARGALRALGPLAPGRSEEACAEELLRSGLLEGGLEEDGWAVRLHPLVKLAVERHAEGKDPEAWKLLRREVALHLLETGSRTGDLPYLIRCRERLFSSGHCLEAYEVQKMFLEELLRRGFYELTRKILLESAATTTGAPRAVSLGNLAIIHKNEGDLEEAVRLYEQVKLEFEAVGDQANVARVYHQLGNTHYLKGDHDRAVDSYRKSLEISLEINERAVAAATRIQIANVEYVQGKHLEALESYRETLKLAEEIQDRNLTAAIHLQMGQLLISLRRLSEAEEELHLAEREAEEIGDQRNLIKVEQLLGMVAGERRDYDHAVQHLERAAETARSLGDCLEMAASCLRIGLLEAERVQFPKAAAALFRALDHLDSTTERAPGAGVPADLSAYRSAVEERVRGLLTQVGPEVFGRILRGLGRDPSPWQSEPAPADGGPGAG
jgi:tetratricopeptide (TPR) repeat protein